MKRLLLILLLLPVIADAQGIAIGAHYGGGIVAYIFQPRDHGYVQGETHGLIAAPNDQSTDIAWYDGAFTMTGTIDTAIGSGRSNTQAIVAYLGAGNYAAYLCDTLTFGGYADWSLPTKTELNMLYINREKIGGFASAEYWSSSEFNKYTACLVDFPRGYRNSFDKTYTCHVRAIRSF